jgi:DNA polymerase-3 subunit beta
MDGQYIIPRETLDAVKPAKYGKIAAPITLDFPVPNPGALQSVTIAGATTATATVVDGRYPDWRRVMPATASNEPAQYQTEYIASFGKIGELFGDKKVKCVIHYNGNNAALVTFPASEAIGVVMPLRVDGTEYPGLPTWAQMSPVSVARAA